MKTMRVRVKFVASRRETMPEVQVGYVRRAGTSLTEVLMSLMIMSIGVVSVATLFPISALRTLEANKQTNSTIARFTAEAFVDVDPQLIHNPDGVAAFPGATVTDSTPYNSAISVTPPGPPPQTTFRGRSYLVDPIGWQAFNESPTTPGSPLPGPFSAFPTPPFSDFTHPTTSPSPPITPLSLPRDFFGNRQSDTVTWPLPRRYVGASAFLPFANPYPTNAAQLIAARVRAMAVATQPDNWKLVAESQVTVISTSTVAAVTGTTGVTLDNDADLSLINLAGTGVYRVVIFDIDGEHSETRTLYNVNAGTLSVDWVPPGPAQPQLLPTRFNASPTTGASPNIGKVRIEVADQVYTWMLSVRKQSSGPASVDVVVFFKRNFDPNNERVFDAEFRKWNFGPDGVPGTNLPIGGGFPNGDDNQNMTANDVGEAGYPGSDDTANGTVTIKVLSVATDDERPKLKRGNYIYDTKNGLWYRIRAVQNEQFGVGPGSNEDWVDVVLDESIRLDGGGAIVHPNVVNVFSLEIKEP